MSDETVTYPHQTVVSRSGAHSAPLYAPPPKGATVADTFGGCRPALRISQPEATPSEVVGPRCAATSIPSPVSTVLHLQSTADTRSGDRLTPARPWQVLITQRPLTIKQ
jgi:hypothetical protein